MPCLNAKLYDALILGAGPAGLSAALGLARVHRSALVLSHNSFRNNGVTAIHAVPSRDGTHPAEFRRITREQIESYGDGIQFVEGEAVRLGKTSLEDGYRGFEAEDRQGRVWRGRKMVLAMGSRDVFPRIEGYAENWPENMYVLLTTLVNPVQRSQSSDINAFFATAMSALISGSVYLVFLQERMERPW